MGPAPAGLAQSWIASFHLSGHFFRTGDHVTGTITSHYPWCSKTSGPWCYSGTDWGFAGAHCQPKALSCTWVAGPGSPDPQWQLDDMPIGNGIGPAHSADYLAIVDKNTYVLDGNVKDTAGNPLPGVAISIFGPKRRYLVTDASGYYNAFLPRGHYTVSVSVGGPSAVVSEVATARWFKPNEKSVDLQSFATVNFTGATHTIITVDKPTLTADGLQMATVTVRDLDPVGQGVAGQALRIDMNGAAALLCSTTTSHVGRVEPADVIDGSPLYLAAEQTTDSKGTLTFQVYAGTQSGTVDLYADEAARAKADITDTTAFSSAHITLQPDTWASSFPGGFTATIYRGNSQGILVGVPSFVGLPHLLWAALHVHLGNAPFPGLGGDPLGNQKTLLRWVLQYVSRAAHLEIAPISGPGGTHPAVLLYVHGHRDVNADTRVLDTDMVTALLDETDETNLPSHLPTLSEWQTIIGGAPIADYAMSTPERGLTYNGFPYLPADDSAYNAFETNCVQKAP